MYVAASSSPEVPSQTTVPPFKLKFRDSLPRGPVSPHDPCKTTQQSEPKRDCEFEADVIFGD